MAVANTMKIRQQGFAMFAMLLCVTVVTLYVSQWNPGHQPDTQVVAAAAQAHESLLAQSIIKGYSRPEELAAVTCPDTDSTPDGQANACSQGPGTLVSGHFPFMTKVAFNQLSLTPNLLPPRHADLHLTVNRRFASGADNSTQDASQPADFNEIAWTLTARNPGNFIRTGTSQPDEGDLPLRVRRSDAQRQEATQRLRAAFFQHIQQAADASRTPLTPEWAFGQTLHLQYDTNSGGQRFTPLTSNCQCRCTSIRCKCGCQQPSQWLTSGLCLTEADSGICQTQAGGARCIAGPNQFCYLKGASRMANHWPVSLYSPRATEGKACRPDVHHECPLSPKSGSECACQFDWPKPLDVSRLARLSLVFVQGKATVRSAP